MGIYNKISDSLIEAIRIKAREAFIKSQHKCPVVTGTLKNSGTCQDVYNGAVINYAAPYASNIERDTEAHIEVVPMHYRRGVRVNTYNRTVKAKKGAHFIENSLKESFNQFADSFDSVLRTKFSTVKRR